MNPIRDEWQSPDGSVRLLLGDCLQILPLLDRESIGAVVTDPPYGIKYNPCGGNGVAQRRNLPPVTGDDQPFDPLPWIAFENVVLWGANHYANKLPSSPSWLVWWKKRGVSGCEFADCELAWSSVGHVAKHFDYRWHGMIRDGMDESGLHPTQKPVAVMQWCLSLTPGELVLDPYLGSGTTGVACIRTQRRFIGIEISEQYFRVAVERCKRELGRFPLFEQQTKPRQAELFSDRP